MAGLTYQGIEPYNAKITTPGVYTTESQSDAEVYERLPLTAGETGPALPAVGDSSDDTDWEEMYRDIVE